MKVLDKPLDERVCAMSPESGSKFIRKGLIVGVVAVATMVYFAGGYFDTTKKALHDYLYPTAEQLDGRGSNTVKKPKGYDI